MKSKALKALQGDEWTYIDNSQDIEALLDSVAFPGEWRKDITGAIVELLDGDYGRIYLTESAAPYYLGTTYDPLPVYSKFANNENLPAYWRGESYD